MVWRDIEIGEEMELIYLIIIAVLSLFVILKSATYAINAIANYARSTGISDYLIGFLIISIGTSLPDLITAITASWIKQGSLILGNVLGANVIDVFLILGLMAVIAKKIKLKKRSIGNIIPIIIMVLIPVILCLDGILTRAEGIILLMAYTTYAYILIKKEGKIGHVKKQVKLKKIILDMVIFVIALIALLLSTRWLVFSSIIIADMFNIPIFIFGLIFIALGTTMPELTIGIKSVLKKRTNIGLGEILGSVVVNLSLILGIAALINPIEFDKSSFISAASFMIFGILFVVYLIKRKEVNWKHGIFALIMYVIFILFEIIRHLI